MEEQNENKSFLNKIYSKISNGIDNEKQIKKNLFYIFCIAIAFIGSIFLIEISFIIIGNFIKIEKDGVATTMGVSDVIGVLGPFGDFFGGILNPILTFCSFMALLMTIILQQKELGLTRKELKETKQATKDSANALIEQSNSIKQQNFENTFFNMLNLYFSLKSRLNQNPPKVENIKYKIDNIDYTFNAKEYERNILLREEGIPRLNHILFLYLNETNRFPKEFRNIPIEEIEEEIQLKYKKNQLSDTKNLYIYFTNIYGKHLNHLMRTIYHIINFVDKNDDIKNKKFYINLLRSQIDISETSLIFYNAISNHGKNLLPLVIKYEFFEHLVYNDFICRPTLKLYIEKTIQLNKKFPINKAFGESYNYKKLLKELYEETNTSSQEQQ
ncbi:MAG: putative phage abortive infection protein [Arcobacter sp.]|uniref:putative phage abortive infection protein n=1 Tax=Arcobacter sp. TaxID=1872629 RepID=UPI003CFDE405